MGAKSYGNMIVPTILTSTILVSLATHVQQSAAAFSQRTYGNNNSSECKCIPGDECWPTPEEWAHFNITIQGKLVAPSQLASVCHDPNYDEAECAYVQGQWTEPRFQFVQPTTPTPCAILHTY